jgi:hypothetical protein
MRNHRARIGMVVAALVLLGAAPQATRTPDVEPAQERPAPLHSDVAALERAVVDTTLAFVREDCKAAREALLRLDAGCRRLSLDESPAPPQDVRLYDQAFHKTIDLAREFLMGEQLERAFDQFVWAQRACRTCHDMARADGLMPAKTPPPKPAD